MAGPVLPAAPIQVGGVLDSGVYRCRSCNRVMVETTESRQSPDSALMRLRCPAECKSTKTVARGRRTREGNPMLGAGRRVQRWV